MATKFYLPSSGAADVTAQAYSASWYSTALASKLKAVTSKISSSMTNKSISDSDSTDRHFCVGMWVSDPIAAQTIAAQTIGLVMRANEDLVASNMFVHWTIRILDSAGNYRATIPVAFRTDGSEVSPVGAGGEAYSRYDSDTSTSVACSDGDRIVIEAGLGGNPTSSDNHNSIAVIGDNSATDLTTTDEVYSADNPWVNFANTITFLAVPTVTTQSCSDVLDVSATGNGTISVTNGNATRRGFCYMTGTSGNPTTANSVVYDDGDFGAGAYTKAITGLSPSTGYRVRAYVTNAAGTNYGATVQLTTTATPEGQKRMGGVEFSINKGRW